MPTKRNDRAPSIDDRWHKRVKQPDGTMKTERAAQYGVETRWRVRWVTDGREYTKVFKRKAEAEACKNTQTADIQRGDYISPNKAGITFGTVAEQWFATKAHRRPKTLAGYRGLLDTLILPRWENTPLKELDYRVLSSWLSGLGVDGSQRHTALSASRIRQTHQLMHAVLKYAQRSGLVSKNVAADIDRRTDMPKETVREQHALTRDQLLALASRCGRYETLTLVLGTCGIRFGEASALRRGNVKDRMLEISASATHVTGKGIVEDATKTGKSRRVPVPAPVWDRLAVELPHRSSALVFPGPNGGLLPLWSYRWVFDKAVAAVQAEAAEARARETAETGQPVTPEFPPITPHDLRHTCASLYISQGANIKVIQRLLGHETAAMTLDRYGHLYADDLSRAADALGDSLTATAV